MLYDMAIVRTYLTETCMRTPELLDSHSDSIIQKQTTNMLFKLLKKNQLAQHFVFQHTKLTVPLPSKQMYKFQTIEYLFFPLD